jgi:hypothetical protein
VGDGVSGVQPMGPLSRRVVSQGQFVYHQLAPDHRGTVLYPLNHLATVYPDIHAREAPQYAGRDAVMSYRVPYLDAPSADMVNFATLDPRLLVAARERLGVASSQLQRRRLLPTGRTPRPSADAAARLIQRQLKIPETHLDRIGPAQGAPRVPRRPRCSTSASRPTSGTIGLSLSPASLRVHPCSVPCGGRMRHRDRSSRSSRAGSAVSLRRGIGPTTKDGRVIEGGSLGKGHRVGVDVAGRLHRQ